MPSYNKPLQFTIHLGSTSVLPSSLQMELLLEQGTSPEATAPTHGEEGVVAMLMDLVVDDVTIHHHREHEVARRRGAVSHQEIAI